MIAISRRVDQHQPDVDARAYNCDAKNESTLHNQQYILIYIYIYVFNRILNSLDWFSLAKEIRWPMDLGQRLDGNHAGPSVSISRCPICPATFQGPVWITMGWAVIDRRYPRILHYYIRRLGPSC